MRKELGTGCNGEPTKIYTLKNKNGIEINVSDFGATWLDAFVPDKDGIVRDVVLGYDTASEYAAAGTFFGATVGRIANRTGDASFVLNGKKYELSKNDNKNNLHSGPDNWKSRVWDVKNVNESEITFVLHSPDGDQGYPGALNMEVSYTLTDDNEVKIHYYGVPEADTIINMTNHAYFNLNGHNSGNVLNQEVWVDADAYTRANEDSIVTGEIVSVEGTPMDFRVKKTIGRDISEKYEALIFGNGYDHNWCLNGSGYRKVAEMTAKESGITMEVYTDLPGVQLYTANFVINEKGKNGVIYHKHQGICFETQLYPNAINKEHFESPIVRAGEVYETVTTYKFI